MFHALTLRDVRRETDACVSLSFEVPEELDAAFAFAPGQYLTLRTHLDGEEVRRSYSLCTAPGDGDLRVAVKTVPGGAFSTWARDLSPGDVLDVAVPEGRFTPAPDPAPGRHVLGVAAGSGITPVMSVLRHVLATEPTARVTLVYGNRTTADVIFREALSDLKDSHLGRLQVVHVLSREGAEVALHEGRVDAERIHRLCATLLDPADLDEVFVCGPQEMSVAVRAALLAEGVDPHRVHVELFGTPSAAPAPPVDLTAAGVPATVVLHGRASSVSVKPGETLLDAGRRAGLDLPWSCHAGVCATCRAHVTGEVEMAANYSLEPWELEAGFRLTCQARPCAGADGADGADRAPLVVDFDA